MAKQSTAEETKSNGDATPDEIKPIPLNAMRLHEFENALWRANLPHDTPLEHLERPELWTRVCGKLRSFDRIEVISRDFWAEILVINCEENLPIRTILLRSMSLSELDRIKSGKTSKVLSKHGSRRQKSARDQS